MHVVNSYFLSAAAFRFIPASFVRFIALRLKRSAYGFWRHRKHIVQFNFRVTMSGFKSHLVGRLLKSIPGTDVLADIAAVKPTVEILRRSHPADLVDAIRWSRKKCTLANPLRMVQ
jgi:hypothetical protein